MNHHNHGHVYRAAQEPDRLLAQYGRKPPEEVRQKLRDSLEREKGKFLELARDVRRTRDAMQRSIEREL